MLLLCLCIVCVSVAHAHPGKTDSNGGHYDHESGEYHYHHGYPAHQHTDLNDDGIRDCPYDFDDKTGENSGNSNGSSTSQVPTTNNNTNGSKPSASATTEKPKHEGIFAILFSQEYWILCIIFGTVLVLLLLYEKTCQPRQTAKRIIHICEGICGAVILLGAMFLALVLTIIGSILYFAWIILRFLWRLIKSTVDWINSL